MFFGFLRSTALRFALLWMLSMASTNAAFALEPATPLSRLARQGWTMENGLPQNSVPVMLQSRDGFLWAGTELGLVRFDGVSFHAFDHATSPAFPDAEIRCLFDSSPDASPAGGPAGDLWIGTGDGLVHWIDGRATRITTREGLPSNSILGLTQTTDGVIWVWTEAGLARAPAHAAGAQFQAVASGNGLPAGSITSIAADTSGGLWVGTTRGLAVFRDGQWRPDPLIEIAKGAKAEYGDLSSFVQAAASRDLLIADGSGVFLEHNGTFTTVLTEAALPVDGVSFLSRLTGGAIVVASKSTLVLAQAGSSSGSGAVTRLTVSKDLPGSRIESIYADREGCLWVGANRGLARISFGGGKPLIQRLPPTDPIASSAVTSLLEDREGDLWVGTETGGLHILRDARFRGIGTSDGLSSDATTAVIQDARHALWIGTRDSGLNRIVSGPAGTSETGTSQAEKPAVTNLSTADGLLSNIILALASAPNGDVWVGTPDGLNRIRPGSSGKGQISSYTSADGLPDDFIRSLLVAPDDVIWIGTRRGLTRLDRGRFQTFTRADGLGSDLVGALARTPDGDLWIATLHGLSRLHQGKLTNSTTADGLSSNVITALDAAPNGAIWIGTQGNGLNLWDGKRFLPIPSQTGPFPTEIHEVVQDGLGHLWLASNTGLTRVDTQGLLNCAEQISTSNCSPAMLHVANFTTADGLRSRETSSNSHPTATRASDGTLWFATPHGVTVVDALHFRANPSLPPVAIERFAVDDRDTQADPGPRITAGAMRFQFDYAGLSFAAPQKLRYQYMLEGFDHSWTDAGARRTAYYTNIPPGSYRFRVRAALGDAAFEPAPTPSKNASDSAFYAPPEAALSFELLPHFYQTLWFRALVLLLIAALILLIFRRRVLRVEHELRAVMGERNRIAREIHDTLAQGYVGISLQLEILGQLLKHNRPDAAEKHLALTQNLVREGLDDARQSIWALRSQDAAEQTLPIRLRRMVEQAADHDLKTGLKVYGAYRALPQETEQEILRIAQEAIHNVKKHAAASNLSVQVDYEERALALAVTDDGKGFVADVGSPAKAAKAGGEGHYGFTGMRERTALIHSEIEIASEPGQGTIVKLRVPAPEAQ
jgi:ligand-binding sensor domain-containing protein/signal transduction histidine kinase